MVTRDPSIPADGSAGATPAPPQAATPRRSTSTRQTEIAEAALRIIGEQGARALTAATLGEEVGVTPGALYRHFASLDEILEAAVERAAAAVEATFPPEDLPPVERLRQVTAARVALIRGTPGLAWLLLSDQVYVSVPAPAVARLQELVARSRAFLRRAVVAAQADGSVRADIEPAIVLTLLSGTVQALAGSSGVHAGATIGAGPTGAGPTSAPGPDPAAVFSAVFQLLSPPSPGESQ